jgi:hypothetical protein
MMRSDLCLLLGGCIFNFLRHSNMSFNPRPIQSYQMHVTDAVIAPLARLKAQGSKLKAQSSKDREDSEIVTGSVKGRRYS